ncbi:ABC transporter substrate-binding protein [Sandaracinus amylolyticus]|uniref:ABC transporter substrate-binding protein n=1 Tax=Sandaracinus amylolyticus TaxID=927083 RepID=UPI001F43022A|nr:ABC transporter substrate-binding protein [Sandaracinus amylolyticus]UJR83986.1 Hypothetical protein I5071_60570 [Sandaracinus amylolyticus]
MSQNEALWYTRCPVPTAIGIADHLGWLAEEFRDDGIEVRRLQDSKDRGIRESHYDHKLDNSFRQGGSVPAIWARSTGRRTKTIGLTWTDEAQVILTLPRSGIRSVRDLRGRRLAVATRPDDLIDFWRATTLRAYVVALGLEGLTTKDVELVERVRGGNSFERAWPPARDRWRETAPEVAALENGEVDAIFHKGSRGLEIAREIGAHVVVDLGKHPDPKVRVNNGAPRPLTVDAGLVERDPELVSRLLVRVIQAGRWAAEHKPEAISIVARETGSTEQAVELAYGEDVHRHLGTDLAPSSVEALSDFKDFLYEWKVIPNDFDVRDWIDPLPLRLAQEALARPGRRDPATARVAVARS